jgi:hypothetical protein
MNRHPRLALLTIFTLHNLEEVLAWSGELPIDVTRLGLTPDLFRRDRFALATVLLTAAEAAVLANSACKSTSFASAFLGTTASAALGLNAVGHVVRTVSTRKYNPGFATSPFLLSSAIVAMRAIAENALTPRQKALSVAVAGTVTAPAILIALKTAAVLRP